MIRIRAVAVVPRFVAIAASRPRRAAAGGLGAAAVASGWIIQRSLAALAMVTLSFPALAEQTPVITEQIPEMEEQIPGGTNGRFSLGTGFDYSSGKYGDTATTDIFEIPVTGRYQSDNVTLMLTVPYISITGPGGVIPGIGRAGQGNAPNNPNNTKTARTTSSGLGDVTASAGYTFHSSDTFDLDLFGNIKFGTADASKGLGTGENDYSAQVDGYYWLDKTTLFAAAGYKVYGSPPGYPLDNVPYGTLGFSQELSDTGSAGMMLDMQKSPIPGNENLLDVTVFLSQMTSSTTRLRGYFLKGFSTSSPDFGFGGMIIGYF
jgi:hypothetical protein